VVSAGARLWNVLFRQAVAPCFEALAALDLMPKLDQQDEIDAYYLADPAHPRAAGIMWPVLIDRRVDRLFNAALRPDKTVRNDLLQSSGPLGTYAVKIRLAYLLGWIGKDVFDDLSAIGKIRNRFAHAIEAKDFSDQKISTWLKGMASYSFIAKILAKAKKENKMESHVSNMAKVLILETALEVDHMGFRFCVDQMLHVLDKCHANMEKNLASLPGGWLTGDETPTRNPKPD
jgi:DNA-binding MltR family transcriptional regulator